MIFVSYVFFVRSKRNAISTSYSMCQKMIGEIEFECCCCGRKHLPAHFIIFASIRIAARCFHSYEYELNVATIFIISYKTQNLLSFECWQFQRREIDRDSQCTVVFWFAFMSQLFTISHKILMKMPLFIEFIHTVLLSAS